MVVKQDNENPWSVVSDDSFAEARSDEPIFEAGVETLTADESYDYVLKNVGATVPKRDYIDARYIKEVEEGIHIYTTNGRLGYVASQDDAEGYPNDTTFKGGEAPLDTDDDGMPDVWEIEHGLNPNDYYDACQVYLSDEGYTNIELYINELAGDEVRYSDNPTIQYTPDSTTTPEDTVMPTETPVKKLEYVAGDINCDKFVNAEDALLVLKHAAKLEEIEANKQVLADLNEDTLIDATDALYILKLAAKLI